MFLGPYYLTEISFADIQPHLNNKIDGSGVSIKKTKVDMKNDRYHFSATSGGDVYSVTVRVERKSGKLKGIGLENADIKCSCSCPAFLYWGSDYNTSALGMLDTRKSYPKPASKGLAPNIRDPEGNRIVCKHIVAALQKYKKLIV